MKSEKLLILIGVGIAGFWYYRYKKGTTGLIPLSALPPPPTAGTPFTADLGPTGFITPIINPLAFNADDHPGFKYSAYY